MKRLISFHLQQWKNDPDRKSLLLDGEKYQWILELKEAHGQKIANSFAAQLSRVGIDESEWLRRTWDKI